MLGVEIGNVSIAVIAGLTRNLLNKRIIPSEGDGGCSSAMTTIRDKDVKEKRRTTNEQMINKEQITVLCEEALAETDRFLVDVKVKPGNVIEVYVDSDTAVNIDQCAELSRFIESRLDRDVEDYELSVFSWGLSGALKLDRQLQKYVGEDVEVKTKEVGKLQGKLVRFDAEQVEIMPAPKKSSKKKPVEEPVNLILERKKVEIKPTIVF